MEISSKRIGGTIVLLCLVLGVMAADPEFPHISDMQIEFYETEVQITDSDEQEFGVATEYFDNTGPRGKLEIRAAGSMQSIYYNNDTFEILEMNETHCEAWALDESIYDYQAIFYGWLNRDPLIIGPSAPLWYANKRRNDIKYAGKQRARKINCDTYTLWIKDDKNDVNLTYYFADPKWLTPFQMDKMRIPIRIEAIGESSKDTGSEELKLPVNLTTDFSYFRPTVSDLTVFQPPLGIGCPLKKPTRTMPDMPKVFRYSAEVFDVKKTDPDNPEYNYDVEVQQIWYHNKQRIARLDKFTKAKYFSELYDFNTGVTYSIENGRTCKIKPLRNAMFEAYDDQMIGHLKEPGEVFNLEGTFYYMGKRLMRNIWCDSFESVQLDVLFMKQQLSKLVISILYSQDFYEVVVDGQVESRVPVYYMVSGWVGNKKVINLQYNIFSFDNVIFPNMYSTFGLARCFPSMKEKSYFVLLMNVGEKLAKIMESMDDLIKLELRKQIALHAKISDMRTPLLTVDYKSTGVTVTGLMLDRPPALQQFYMEFEGDVEVADKYLKLIVDADTQEKCAFACVGNANYTCMGFYWCGTTCTLKSKGLFDKVEPGEKTTKFGETCQTWIRVTRDSSNDEAYLKDALKSLENAVLDQKVAISFKIDGNTDKVVPIEQIAIGDGPYTGTGQDKPYDIVINFAKLDKDFVTTTAVDYIDNVQDCYQACKKSDSLACASFSFCGKAENKQCLLSSNLYVDRERTGEGLKDDSNCYVYSMKYLDLYEPYPGRVSLLGGDDVVSGVKTLEECARNCREDTKVKCRGFEFCRSTKSCILHSKHILDLKPGETDIDTKSPCVHYAAKFSTDYDDMGYTLIDDKSDVRNEISLEECAKTCSEELKANCKSFNYCPASDPYSTDSSCAISGKVLKDNPTTTTKAGCHHYEKKQVSDWKKTDKKAIPQPSGYTSKGFTGLVIGMLAFGLIVGVLGFVGYSYYRSRSTGDNMTVRFMKQPT